MPEGKYYVTLSHKKGEIMRTLLLLLLAMVAIGMLAPNPIMADRTVKLTVGPIWNDGEAQEKCEAALDRVAQKNPGHNVSWDGNWDTIVEGKQSVCTYTVED
jgi:hypothetical protein